MTFLSMLHISQKNILFLYVEIYCTNIHNLLNVYVPKRILFLFYLYIHVPKRKKKTFLKQNIISFVSHLIIWFLFPFPLSSFAFWWTKAATTIAKSITINAVATTSTKYVDSATIKLLSIVCSSIEWWGSLGRKSYC